jgi:hypothetical protein
MQRFFGRRTCDPLGGRCGGEGLSRLGYCPRAAAPVWGRRADRCARDAKMRSSEARRSLGPAK